MPLNRCPLNTPRCRYTEKYPAIHSRNPPHALWRPEGENSGRSWLPFTQCTKRTRHLYIVNNEIMQQMHYVDQWHMQGLRGREKKTGYQSLSGIGFSPAFVCPSTFHPRTEVCVCARESWFDNPHTISPWAKGTLEEAISPLSRIDPQEDAAMLQEGGGFPSQVGVSECWLWCSRVPIQQRSTSERSAAAHAKTSDH